jgi:hypothetical protein
MDTKEIQVAICSVQNRAISNVLYQALRDYQGCNNVLIYGRFRKLIKHISQGNKFLYDQAVNVLYEILKKEAA